MLRNKQRKSSFSSLKELRSSRKADVNVITFIVVAIAVIAIIVVFYKWADFKINVVEKNEFDKLYYDTTYTAKTTNFMEKNAAELSTSDIKRINELFSTHFKEDLVFGQMAEVGTGQMVSPSRCSQQGATINCNGIVKTKDVNMPEFPSWESEQTYYLAGTDGILTFTFRYSRFS